MWATPILILGLFGSSAIPGATWRRPDGSDTVSRRFALIVGANDGGRNRVLLRYAASDARAFSAVMNDLGGVAHDDAVVLLDPSHAGLVDGMQRFSQLLAKARPSNKRIEAVVYYSGHSNETGLLFGDNLLTYERLRAYLNELKADVSIAILDSCASGALTRSKGGIRRPAFVVDASTVVRGHAFLTSASATEAAQESDAIGGSFFTHYLVSGLRGAADLSGDRKVSLAEAYQFAFDETLARTEQTQAGAQHPNYDYQLAGAGDLVLTDLRGTSATLAVGASLSGRLYLRDSSDRLIAELRKVSGRVTYLGLEPGEYSVTVDDGRAAHGAKIELEEGEELSLTPRSLHRVDRERLAVRGDSASMKIEPDATYEQRNFCFSVVPSLSTCSARDKKLANRVSLGLFMDAADRIESFQLSLLLSNSSDGVLGVQGAGIGNVSGGPLRGTQIGGVFNFTSASADGVQGAGIFNATTGTLRGAQVAGIANYLAGSGPMTLQVSGIGNAAMSDEFRGVQVSSIANVVRSDIIGGFQGSTILNWAGGYVEGAQFALINVSGGVHGAQLGFVNIAAGPVRGSQVGIINVAERYDSGAPAGIINFVKDGTYHLDVWSSDLALANLSLKFGAGNVYTLATIGYNPKFGRKNARSHVGLGVGGKLDVGDSLFLALDIAASQIHFHKTFDQAFNFDDQFGSDQDQNLQSQLRLMVGYAIAANLSVFAGAALNTHYAWVEADDRPGLVMGPEKVVRDGERIARFWPGFFGGVEY